MPTFDTPGPISVTIELGVGDLRITATDRVDTVVEVQPSDPAKPSDVTAAEQTRVEFADGVLQLKAPEALETPRGRRFDRGAHRAARWFTSYAATPGSPTLRCHRHARRLPLQDRRRRHHRRACRRDGGPHDGHRAGQGRAARRIGDAQERQRRHVDRRGWRRPSGQGRQRKDRRGPGPLGSDGQDRKRRHPPRRGDQRQHRRRDGMRQGGRRRARRGRRLAGPAHRLRPCAQPARCRRASRPVRRHRAGAGSQLLR